MIKAQEKTVLCKQYIFLIHSWFKLACVHRFYQKVPEQVPDIPSGVVYGLATPEDLTLPPHNPLWTEEVYTALIDKKPEYPAAGAQEIAPIPEPDVAPGQNPAPKTESSCIIA